MSEELKPCPFCGGSVHQQGVDNVIKCDACGVTICIPMSDKQEEAFEQGLVFDNWDIAHVAEFWNARAERTCHLKAGVGGWFCSECGVFINKECIADAQHWITPPYCANCRAKVVG